METNVEAILDCDLEALTIPVKRSCEIKAAIVAADETEQGGGYSRRGCRDGDWHYPGLAIDIDAEDGGGGDPTHDGRAPAMVTPRGLEPRF